MQKNLPLIRIEHIWSVLCGNSSVDSTTQNVSLFNVLEQLNVSRKGIDSGIKPGAKVAIPLNFQLVTLLRRIGVGSFQGSMKIEIVDPNNALLGTNENEIKFADPTKDRLRVIIRAAVMPLTTSGYYLFKISIKPKSGEYEEVEKVPLQIKITDQ